MDFITRNGQIVPKFLSPGELWVPERLGKQQTGEVRRLSPGPGGEFVEVVPRFRTERTQRQRGPQRGARFAATPVPSQNDSLCQPPGLPLRPAILNLLEQRFRLTAAACLVQNHSPQQQNLAVSRKRLHGIAAHSQGVVGPSLAQQKAAHVEIRSEEHTSELQ